MTQEPTLREFREFILARAKCYDKFFKESEGRAGWMGPRELEEAFRESDLLHDTREKYLAALVMLDEFEKLMQET